MKTIYKSIAILAFTGVLSSCDSWFDVESRSLMTEEQIYSTKDGVTSVLANIYSRIPDSQGFSEEAMCDWDEAVWHPQGGDTTTDYGDSYRRYYDYGLIREINLLLQNIDIYGQNLNPEDIKYFKAEARFLRGYVYFQMLKNMGGVPLILEAFELNPGDTQETFERPREKESDMYDWIASEMDEIKEDLNINLSNPVKNRASKGSALALKCRAMLYAGSIAKYTSERTDLSLTLPGGETGIPAEKANDYFQACLSAARELEKMNVYRLYNANGDKIENFYEALVKKNNENPEAIFVKDYDGERVKNYFTGNTIPRSLRTAASGGSSVAPTLNLVEKYELIDGGIQPLVTVNSGVETVEDPGNTESNLDYKVYEKAEDIFADRDPRLFGTILTPGSSFKSKEIQLWAGLAVWENGKYTFKHVTKIEDLESAQDNLKYYDGRQITGTDGPHYASPDVTNTGFLLRKYVDTKPGSETEGKSDIAFIRFRYAEVLLNAAEAAYELESAGIEPVGTALGYINQIRERAGIKKLDRISSIEQIRHEREVELAFEDHRFYDVKRWRTGDKVFDGNKENPTAEMCGLWPYKIYRPGHPDDGKWIFRRVAANKRINGVKFINGNYYSSFDSNDLSRNSLLVKNPYQM